MEIIKTDIAGVLIYKPRVFTDERGYFFESFNKNQFEKQGLESGFIQDNESYSRKGVVRGLHFQVSPFPQAKLVRVIKGLIKDVAVDLRKDSPTFGSYTSCLLNDENKYQFFVPAGFAHGFSVLSEEAIVAYKCTEKYDKASERGIHPLCKSLAIDWGLTEDELILSVKDKESPDFYNYQRDINPDLL